LKVFSQAETNSSPSLIKLTMEGVIGYTTMFAGNFAPKNWAFCQAQIVNIASNTALFSILGTVYGGNGTTTFGLPDIRGRRVIGAGNGPGLQPYSLGEMGGASSATLSMAQMPAHVHPVTVVAQMHCFADSATASSPATANYANASVQAYSSAPDTTMAAGVSANITMAPNGGNQPFSIEPPVLGINYIICLRGVYPARN
jgi:microcystin-dependent protein